MVRATLTALLAALCTNACATAFAPRGARIHLLSDPPGATVLDSAGKTLGTTPLHAMLHPREQQRLSLFAPGSDTVVVTVGRRVREVLITVLNPFSLLVDGFSGAYWEHEPSRFKVTLRPSSRGAVADARLEDREAAVVLNAFAAAAEAAGCDTLLAGAWRDAAIELGARNSASVPDSIHRFAAEEARRAAPELRSLCAARTPRLERLGQIDRALRPGALRRTEADEAALAPVYFELGRWEVRDDSVRRRLHATGRRLAASGLPVRLVVEGFTDPSGIEVLNRELGYSRANAVIRELQRGGLPRDCCVAVSHPAPPAGGSAAAAATPDVRVARRVTFSLDYREDAP
jgi:outer membrane protein OmpA-like peptidoglycan-associated protein